MPWARLGNGQSLGASKSAGVLNAETRWPDTRVGVGRGPRAQTKVG